MVNPFMVKKLEGHVSIFEKRRWKRTPYKRKIRKRERDRSAIISEIMP
jgi:hypothetical protein